MEILFKNKILLVILLTIPAFISLLHPGYFPSHDGTAHLLKVVEFDKMISDGQFPVRWASNFSFGYGVPLFNFYSPLFYYLTSLGHWLGLGYFGAIKVVLILGLLLGAVGIYVLCRHIYGEGSKGDEGYEVGVRESAGVIGAVLYTYIPYRFLDVYVRGAYAEFLALAIVPWVLWGFLRTKWLAAGVSLAALILAHNFTGLIFLGFLGGIGVVKEIRGSGTNWVLGILLGLGLSAFFWIPSIFEQKYLISGLRETVNYQDHFVTLGQLWDSPWGYGSSLPGTLQDGMSFQIGKIHLVLMILVFLFVLPKAFAPIRRIIRFLVVLTLFFLFLTLENSLFIWQNLTFLHLGQFPWRFLGFAALTVSLVGAGIAGFLVRQKVIFWGLVAILIVLSLSQARPAGYILTDDRKMENPNATRSWDEWGFLPEGVEVRPTKTFESRLEAVRPKDEKIESKGIGSTHYRFSVESSQKATYHLNLFYFPGWEIKVDGLKQKINLTESGTMEFKVDSGQHEVKVEFGDTPLRRVSNLISLASVGILVIFGVLGMRKRLSS